MIITGIGHGPDKLGGYSDEARLVLAAVAIHFIRMLPEKPTIISGMALGWDTSLAEAALVTGCTLYCYAPFEGQEKMWSKEQQEFYHKILKRADIIKIFSEGDYEPWKMQHRNKMMIDACDQVFAMYDGSPGGTANCIAYAIKKHKNILNLYPTWHKLK